MPAIYRITCRDQKTGKVLWQQDMTVAEYETWLYREKKRIDAALKRHAKQDRRFGA
jgi:hypothetical protein